MLGPGSSGDQDAEKVLIADPLALLVQRRPHKRRNIRAEPGIGIEAAQQLRNRILRWDRQLFLQQEFPYVLHMPRIAARYFGELRCQKHFQIQSPTFWPPPTTAA